MPLFLAVWDWDRLKEHDFLGDSIINEEELKSIIALGDEGVTKELAINPQGTIHVKISFSPIAH